jgi:hypothetical protein
MVKQVQIMVCDVLQLDKQSHSNLFRDPVLDRLRVVRKDYTDLKVFP